MVSSKQATMSDRRALLTDREREKILNRLNSSSDEDAWILASYCGLRRGEIEAVEFRDIRQRENGDWIVRVYEENNKTDDYRETPIPERFAYKLKTRMKSSDDLDADDTVVQSSMRTVSRHLKQTVTELAEDEDDEAWESISLHDGRRTFANTMLDEDVPPLQVMEWGAWDDWQTFRDHYLHDHSEDYQSEQIQKVSWI